MKKSACITVTAALVLSFMVMAGTAFAQSGFTRDGYSAFLGSVENMTLSRQLSEHAPGVPYFKGGIPPSLEGVAWLDSVMLRYNLTDDELALLERNRFVVTERLSEYSFGHAFHRVYGHDLPVFISTDAVLHAIHMSYDRILMHLEQELLLTNLTKTLDGLSDALPTLGERYGGDERMRMHLADIDLYVAMARSLFAGEKLTPRYCDGATFDAVWDAAKAERMTSMKLFSGIPRNLDFSQLTVRGHYADAPGKPLDTYFRAMMWLGRMDFMLTPPPDYTDNTEWEADVRRMGIDAALLDEVIEEAGVRGLMAENDAIITFMVGECDNMTPAQFSDVRTELGLERADDLFDDDVYAAFREKIESSGEYGQRILSGFFIMNPFSSEPDPLPVSYRLMGQRFVIDSYIFSNVVYDRIVNNGIKIWRPLPDPLDAMFVLGNDDALPLLADELDRYNYSSQLEALRYLVDAYDDDFWGQSLYNTWLGALRQLNPPSTDAGLPLFMKTSAWHQEKINTQLASWSQLRHDTLLYAKQSYTGGTLCSYPHSYVEPYPAFYAAIGDFADRAEAFFSTMPGDSWYMYNIRRYFPRLRDAMRRLETIAEKELAGIAFDADETDFLSKMLFIQSGSGAPPFSGWYAELFYEMALAADYNFIIADVHTQPTDEFGTVVGNVLHVGTGHVDLGVFIAESPSNGFQPTAFVGPVMSYYQTVTSSFDRLTDERWTELVLRDTANIPARPDWVNIYLADRQGLARSQGRELSGIPFSGTGVDESAADVPTAFVSASNSPNPFNPSTTIRYTLSVTGTVRVEVFDILGRKVATLAEGVRDVGEHAILWNAAGLPSGIYFCRVSAGKSEAVVRMTMVK